MKKKLTALLLIAAAITANVAFADYEAEYEVPYEEAYEDVEVNPAQVYFNGQDMGVIDGFISLYSELKYIDVAQILGYETTYDDTTRTVISVKEDTKIVIPIDNWSEQTATKTVADEVEELPYIMSDIYDDRLYINSYIYVQIFDEARINLSYTYTEEGNRICHIYEIEPLKKRLTDKSDNLKKYIELVSVANFPNQKSEGTIECVFDAPNFGTKIEGSCDLVAEEYYQDGKLSLSLNADTTGIMNVISVALQGAAGAFLDKIDVDLKKPLDFELYSDTEGTYVKSDLLHNLFLTGIIDYYNTDEFKNKVIEDTAGKYIKYDAELVPEELSENIEALSDSYEMLINMLVELAINTGNDSYESVIECIDSYAALFDEKHLVIKEKSAGDFSVTYKVSKNDIMRVVMAVAGDEYSEMLEDKQFKHFMENMQFEGTTVCNITSNGKLTTKGDLKFSMGIPNMWGIDIGTFTIKVTSSGSANSLEKELKAPNAEDVAEYSKLEEESISDSEQNTSFFPEAENDEIYDII